MSTHMSRLPVGNNSLPPEALQAHIVPGLKPNSLISIGQLCDSGCIATLNAETADISFEGNTILTGIRNPTSGLWQTDLQPQSPPISLLTKPVYSCNALHPASTIATRMAWLHACAFSPAKSTFLKAIKAGHFTTWPELTEKLVRKHLPESRATHKGHLDQTRQNLRSTQLVAAPMQTAVHDALEDDDDNDPDLVPSLEPSSLAPTHAIYASSMPITGQVFSDATGRFVLPSNKGNTHILVIYDEDSNCIFAEPMKSGTGAQHLKAYSLIHALLTKRGLKPKLQKLDNEASLLLKTFLEYQLVPPHVHQRNKAERMIRTFKNHFIAGLCTADPDFPLCLWDRLLPQALLTLNLLRTSRINPQLSAHAQVFGAFDFNRTPIGPPGTRVMVFESPQVRETWAPHAVDGWYLGPAMEHYRCFTTWIADTRAERVSDTIAWLPTQLLVPTASSSDAACAAALDLISALQRPSPASALSPFADSETAALIQLADIFRSRYPAPPVNPPPGFPPLLAPGISHFVAPIAPPAPATPAPSPATPATPSVAPATHTTPPAAPATHATPPVAAATPATPPAAPATLAILAVPPAEPGAFTYAERTSNPGKRRRAKAKKALNTAQHAAAPVTSQAASPATSQAATPGLTSSPGRPLLQPTPRHNLRRSARTSGQWVSFDPRTHVRIPMVAKHTHSTKVQRHNGSMVQRLKSSKVQRHNGSMVQRLKSSKVQKYKGSKV